MRNFIVSRHKLKKLHQCTGFSYATLSESSALRSSSAAALDSLSDYSLPLISSLLASSLRSTILKSFLSACLFSWFSPSSVFILYLSTVLVKLVALKMFSDADRLFRIGSPVSALSASTNSTDMGGYYIFTPSSTSGSLASAPRCELAESSSRASFNFYPEDFGFCILFFLSLSNIT